MSTFDRAQSHLLASWSCMHRLFASAGRTGTESMGDCVYPEKLSSKEFGP